MTDLRFPIGEFNKPERLTPRERLDAIQSITEAPSLLRKAVEGLTQQQIDTRYRPDGWTVRQVVHHVADSHLNAYCRFSLTLTEDVPTIRTYFEDRWAKLEYTKAMPLEVSLTLIDAVHVRWVLLLRSLEPADMARKLDHPEIGPMNLDSLLAMYAWHGPHHIAHITSLRERSAW